MSPTGMQFLARVSMQSKEISDHLGIDAAACRYNNLMQSSLIISWLIR